MIYRASRLAFLNPRIWKNYLMHYMQISPAGPKACLMSDAYSYYNLYKILLTYVTFVTLDVLLLFLPKILAFDKIWIHMLLGKRHQNMYLLWQKILHDCIIDIIFTVTLSFLVHKFDFDFIPFHIDVLWNWSVTSTAVCGWTSTAKYSENGQKKPLV